MPERESSREDMIARQACELFAEMERDYPEKLKFIYGELAEHVYETDELARYIFKRPFHGSFRHQTPQAYHEDLKKYTQTFMVSWLRESGLDIPKKSTEEALKLFLDYLGERCKSEFTAMDQTVELAPVSQQIKPTEKPEA